MVTKAGFTVYYFVGLGSILFAINVDNPDLNTIRRPSTAVNIPSSNKLVSRLEEEPRPVIAGEESPAGSYGMSTLQ